MIKCKPLALLTRIVFFCTLALWLAGPGPAGAEESKKEGASIAIVPFQVNAPKDLAYLRNGIRDMLASRLAAIGVRVLDKAAIGQALGDPERVVQPAEMAALSQKLQADYLLTGSLTALGGGASLDAQIFNRQTQASQNFFSTATKEDEVIGAVNQLAQEMGVKVFGQAAAGPVAAVAPAGKAPVAASGGESSPAAHPERAFLGAQAGAASPFIRPTGMTGGFGFTKSQNFPISLRAMDVGDVDGDGHDEVVLADSNKVMVYRMADGRFSKIAELTGLAQYKIHHLSVADLDKDGKAEIYVSAADDARVNSYALTWQDNKLNYLFKDEPHYLRALTMPTGEEVLLGQQAGNDYPFVEGVYKMKQDGGSLREGERIILPSKINLFDFTLIDVDGDEHPEVVSIDQRDHLLVSQPAGKQMWKSEEFFGGTTRYVGEAKKEQRADLANEQGRVYIPSRIVVANPNHDPKPTIIVNKNISSVGHTFKNLKSYPSGELHARAWDGIALSELWHTRKIDGYIADYQIREVEPGKAILYVGVVLHSGVSDIFSSQESTVLVYPLDLAPTTTNKGAQLPPN